MFSSRSLFSNIQCPATIDCRLDSCLFQHNTKTESQAIFLGVEIGEDATSEVELQRKRRKLDPGVLKNPPLRPNDQQNAFKDTKPSAESSEAPLGAANYLIHKQDVAQKAQKIQPAKVLQTVRNTVSPPPPRRKPETSVVKDAVSSSSIPARKAESLNPRMLAKAPAPHDMRFKLVKLLHDQFKRLNSDLARIASSDEEKLVMSDQNLIFMALDLEEQTAKDKPTIYSNVIKNKILVYRKMSVSQWKKDRQAEYDEAQASITKASPVKSLDTMPRIIDTGLTPAEEIKILPRLYTDIAGLTKHGYVNEIPTEEAIATAKSGIEASKGWELCDRCKSRFQVFPGRREDGALTSGGKCTYHWARVGWQDKDPLNPRAERTKKYKCCGESVGDSAGCVQTNTHVFKVSEVKRLAAVLNFEKTPENKEVDGKTPVNIDCEMGYTVHGLELIRLTATRWPGGEDLLDVLVRPLGEILDLNSRFSGVWPQQMADAIPYIDDEAASSSSKDDSKKLRVVSSPAVARSLLFRHLSPTTPVIGHGLENDLNATRFIHPTIIDTILLYPHHGGLPYRYGLKALTYMHLKRHIQVVKDGRMEGHDSKEDANAAGELVRWAVRTEWKKMQREGWTLVEGEFLAPMRNATGGMSADYLEQSSGEDQETTSTSSKKRTGEEAGIE